VEDTGYLPASFGAGADTLADRMLDRDRGRFVGRTAELAFLERCLGTDPPASIVLVHGAGGIGKSTLLRELARRAALGGRETFFVEGRELSPVTARIASAATWSA
jgi:predicted ATP-dependent serine protease